jgi:hypothetical protein
VFHKTTYVLHTKNNKKKTQLPAPHTVKSDLNGKPLLYKMKGRQLKK